MDHNTVAGLIFILLYLQAFSRPGRYRLLCILAMMTMAAVFIPLNGGAIGSADLCSGSRWISHQACAACFY